jgi:hypothetical protein
MIQSLCYIMYIYIYIYVCVVYIHTIAEHHHRSPSLPCLQGTCIISLLLQYTTQLFAALGICIATAAPGEPSGLHLTNGALARCAAPGHGTYMGDRDAARHCGRAGGGTGLCKAKLSSFIAF